MTLGETNRMRIVSIHADEVLHFRFGTEEQVARWKPLARDGADLPLGIACGEAGAGGHGAGRDGGLHLRADEAGEMMLEVWIGRGGQRIVVPVTVAR